MTVPARRLQPTPAADFDDDRDEDFAAREFYSGERVCPPPDRSDRHGALWALLVILIAAGVGWAFLHDDATWRGWLAAKIAAVSASIDGSAPRSPEAAAPAPPPNVPVASTEPAPQPAAADPAPPPPQPPAAPAETQAAAAVVETPAVVEEAPATPLPPPKADPADPYQVRAAAVGLHPDLSRVLLARLSPADYRNAGVAIDTAVAKTPDTATFVWPRQRKPELALFEVRFVPGAAPHCRRYVVTVTKDGWSTTARPMEKCGIGMAGRRKQMTNRLRSDR